MMQKRLEERYSMLASTRDPGLYVFGLEHGLEDQELPHLADVVAATAAGRQERDRSWLAWIAYASEIGLQYDGLGFWDKFVDGMGLRAALAFDSTERDWIRAQFNKFAREYRGAQPRGRWANHFGIIAGPITNAILPTDLQVHLAQVLVNLNDALRARIGPNGEADANAIGGLIDTLDIGGSDRWKMFKENHTLVGQFAIAVLQKSGSASSLTLETVDRVLRRAVEVHGKILEDLLRVVQTSPTSSRGRGTRFQGAPRLSLRLQPDVPTRITAVELSLPNLSAASQPAVSALLAGARCVTDLAPHRPIPRGSLLASNQTVVLSAWPIADTQLIKFETAGASGGSSDIPCAWKFERVPCLFRIRDDDAATQVEGQRLGVLPGKDYIFVRQLSLASAYPLPTIPMTAGSIQVLHAPVPNMQFIEIRLPTVVPAEWDQVLDDLGLQLLAKMSVEPIGIPPADWDGQSRVVRLTGCPLLMRVRIARDADLAFTLEGAPGAPLRRKVSAGEAVVLQVDEGSDDPVSILIEAHMAGGIVDSSLILIETREPDPEDPLRAGGMRVWQVPESKAGRLEALVDGSVAVEAIGPKASRAIVTLEVLDRHGVLKATSCVTAPLPLDGPAWAEVRNTLIDREDILATLDDSVTARLRLGVGSREQVLQFEREYQRLRWRFKRAPDLRYGKRYMIMLQDDGAHSGTFLQTKLYPYGSADSGQQSPSVKADEEFQWEDSGGLLLVQGMQGSSAGLILPPPVTEGLPPAPRLAKKHQRDVEGVSELLELSYAWSVAECPVSHAITHPYRSMVLHLLGRKAAEVVCGTSWGAAERDYLDADLRHRHDRWDQIWVDLVKACPLPKSAPRPTDFCREDLEGRVRLFARLVPDRDAWPPRLLGAERRLNDKPHRLGVGHWLAEFCLRVASDPGVAAWADTELKSGIDVILALPCLLKFARMLVFQAVLDCEPSNFPPLFSEWDWR